MPVQARGRKEFYASIHKTKVAEWSVGDNTDRRQNAALAKEHNPEFRLVTKNIEEVYKRVSELYPQFLHPNLKVITLRPWGAKEFALMDKQLGIIIQEW